MPDNRDFCGAGGAKIHKCNMLLGAINNKVETLWTDKK
jgi:hypothetical protein